MPKLTIIVAASENNVIGKNSYRNQFKYCIREIELLVSKNKIIKCSPKKNKKIFDLTIGGFGLTGIILSAKIKVRKINNSKNLKINFEYISKILKKNKTINKIVGGYYPYNYEVDAIKILEKFEKIVYEISLPRKEFELLFLLASKPGKVFKRESILESIWGKDVIVGDRTIDVHIRTLRENIGDSYFKTIKGVGYKFKI